MSAYRHSACAFCESPSQEVCPRCEDPVCAAHGVATRGWCTVCANELKDDLDVATFGLAVNDLPREADGIFSPEAFGRPGLPIGKLLAEALLGVRGFRAARRVRRVFAARTREDIARWRRVAGVGTRRDRTAATRASSDASGKSDS